MTYKPSRRQLLEQSVLGTTMLSGHPFQLRSVMPATAPTREGMAALINGYQTSQMLHVAAKLRIADLLKDGPRSTADLAAAAGAQEDALYRVMRTLASLGIFTEMQGRRFELNPAARISPFRCARFAARSRRRSLARNGCGDPGAR